MSVSVKNTAGVGVTSDETTATASDVISGKTYLGSDTNDGIGTGTFTFADAAVKAGGNLEVSPQGETFGAFVNANSVIYVIESLGYEKLVVKKGSSVVPLTKVGGRVWSTGALENGQYTVNCPNNGAGMYWVQRPNAFI